jgi:hypothetical protein
MKRLLSISVAGALIAIGILFANFYEQIQAQTGHSTVTIANFIYDDTITGAEFVRTGSPALNFTAALDQTLNSEYILFVNGMNTINFYLAVPTGGSVRFEGANGTEWETISMRSMSDDLLRSTTDADGYYIGSVAGFTRFRFKVAAAGSAPGIIYGNLTQPVSVLEGIEFGNPPHRFGYDPIHVDASYATQQTNTAIFTADSSKKSVVTDAYIVVSGTTDCRIEVFDETNSSGNRLFAADVEVSTNKNFVWGHTFSTPYVASAVGNSWRITTSAACKVDLAGHGYQF